MMSKSIGIIALDITLPSDETAQSKLNRETAKIQWHELQRFYAGGAVIGVIQGVDLIEVAAQFSDDNKVAVEQWLAQGEVFRVTDEQAAIWYEQNITLWSVVVAPWVLVQEV
ncbi:MAG: DUF2288 domain-containing protein [Oceanicoccus sp.]